MENKRGKHKGIDPVKEKNKTKRHFSSLDIDDSQLAWS